jgi:hypothetical protein
MQFLAGTWATYGVDGNGDGRIDRWDAADAVFAAANYLQASGVRSDQSRAVFAYNHEVSYVQAVEAWARRYRSDASEKMLTARVTSPLPRAEDLSWLAAGTRTPVLAVAGIGARLDPSDGHVALIPVQAPPVVQAMLVAGNELQDLAYGPAGHPDPRGVGEEDCSSTVNYVRYRSGLSPIAQIVRDNPLAQGYVHWGEPGPGRWVTTYATAGPPAHVFIVIAGLRLDTSHHGTDFGPNRLEDGPRWRILDHIPTWAHWSVRHPPGL